MRSPNFWQHDGPVPTLLGPLGWLYTAATARRMAAPGWRAPVPVICCGNASVGGAGKTTLALDIGARLAARGRPFAFLTRGYGGRLRGPLQVTAAHTAADVGDEALLLAQRAPCFLGGDRAATARLAIADGAQALVMDDGLQNPTLAKDFSFLVIDGEAAFGNRRVIPAGPLREPVASAAARCRAAVLIGHDKTDALSHLPPGLPVLRATLRSEDVPTAAPLHAFAGIGRPAKFFATLEAAGGQLVGRTAFPDHHAFRPGEVEVIIAAAARSGAIPVTTPKDAMRLPPALRAAVHVVGVRLDWERPSDLDELLDGVLR